MSANSDTEQLAWELYCKETAGDMDVRDYWEQLPLEVRMLYVNKIQMQGEGVNLEAEVYQDEVTPDMELEVLENLDVNVPGWPVKDVVKFGLFIVLVALGISAGFIALAWLFQ